MIYKYRAMEHSRKVLEHLNVLSLFFFRSNLSYTTRRLPRECKLRLMILRKLVAPDIHVRILFSPSIVSFQNLRTRGSSHLYGAFDGGLRRLQPMLGFIRSLALLLLSMEAWIAIELIKLAVVDLCSYELVDGPIRPLSHDPTDPASVYLLPHLTS